MRDTGFCHCYNANYALGLRRVEVTEDTKIPNAATIKIVKQDHTLGNMLRAYVKSIESGVYVCIGY